jgi:hypothetical protein
LIQWPPNYQKVVLERGDVYAPHVSASGGLSIVGLGVTPSPETGSSLPDDREWLEWLQARGVQWDDRDDQAS